MPASRHPVARELLIAIALIAGSLAILPGIIYAVGMRLFGNYQGGVRQMYLDTLADLLKPTWAAWILALTPALCVLALRLIFRRPNIAPSEVANDSESKPRRQEPTVS